MKIAELEARVQEEIYWFKRVKYRQAYKDWTQGKPPRYSLEADVAREDEVDFVTLVSGVFPSPTAPEMIVESSQDLPVSGATLIPLIDPSSEAGKEPVADDDTDLAGPSSKAVKESRHDTLNV